MELYSWIAGLICYTCKKSNGTTDTCNRWHQARRPRPQASIAASPLANNRYTRGPPRPSRDILRLRRGELYICCLSSRRLNPRNQSIWRQPINRSSTRMSISVSDTRSIPTVTDPFDVRRSRFWRNPADQRKARRSRSSFHYGGVKIFHSFWVFYFLFIKTYILVVCPK